MYNAKVYRKQGGKEFVVANGGKITIQPGGQIDFGSSSTPGETTVVGDKALALYVNPTLTNGAKNYNIVAESYLAMTDTFTTQGSGLYTGRFVAGVKTGKTFKGSANQGYIVGAQAKLDNKGVIGDGNSGGIYAAAGLSQVSGAGTYGADAQLYGHWIDFQSGMGAPPATAHMLNITNNSGQTVRDAVKVYGGNGLTYLMDLDTCGGMIGAKVDADVTYAHYKKVAVIVDGVAGWLVVGFNS
jgi:hypothetical protein